MAERRCMQMGSKFPGGEEGGCTRAAGRCKFPPGRERGAGCGEFGVGGQGREQGLGAGGKEGYWWMLYLGVSFQERERLHACLLASKFLAGEGAWGGEGGCMYIEGGGGSRFPAGRLNAYGEEISWREG